METCFTSCSAFTRAEEGGYVADSRDSGNWSSGHVGQGTLIGSNMGVGAPALLAWIEGGGQLTAEKMRTLSLKTAEAIARHNYWTPLGCGALPAGIDLMAFDFGWNRGIGTSLSVMIECLELKPHRTSTTHPADIASAFQAASTGSMLRHISSDRVQILQRALGVQVDGVAGRETVGASGARPDLRGVAAILALSTAQVASYRQLRNFPTYGRGWLARWSRRQAAALFAAREEISVNALA